MVSFIVIDNCVQKGTFVSAIIEVLVEINYED